jgi:glyoxylase-like metal-dependent hydrolase (beta-lactamase superfamily II)
VKDFMVEEVFPEIYRMEIPIPRSPLKATNAYVIKGTERSLLIDSGQNCAEALTAIQAGLRELQVDLHLTDIFVTHMHADHSGLLPFLRQEGTCFFASAADADVINHMFTEADPMEPLRVAACQNGFAPEEAVAAIQRHPGNDIGSKAGLEFNCAADGDIIAAGPFHFRCVATPGHTQGHLCLYEPEHKLLISGDHILGDISPNITYYWGERNPLQQFLNSLNLVDQLDVVQVLPGHRRLFADCRGRIKELREHHQHRLSEAYSILQDGPLTGYQVAAHMTWDMVFRSWDEVAPVQKFFATGEALAHLQFLLAQEKVQCNWQNGAYWYSKK